VIAERKQSLVSLWLRLGENAGPIPHQTLETRDDPCTQEVVHLLSKKLAQRIRLTRKKEN